MRDKIDNTIKYILVALMIILVLDVVWQVFSRYILQSPSVFTSELAGFLLIWVSILGAAYAAGKKMHLSIDILPKWLSSTNERRLSIFINLLIICFIVLVMIIGGGLLVYYSMAQTTPVLRIPMGYVYAIVPFSGIIIIYYKCLDILSAFPVSSQNKQ